MVLFPHFPFLVHCRRHRRRLQPATDICQRRIRYRTAQGDRTRENAVQSVASQNGATTSESPAVTVETLQAICAAFNQHDFDAILSYFADDCVLEMPAGPDPWGRRYQGRAEVRGGLATRFVGMPDVHYSDESHWVHGDFGVSEWTITGTTTSGQKVQARGCDHWTFRDGLVVKKDSDWKNVSR